MCIGICIVVLYLSVCLPSSLPVLSVCCVLGFYYCRFIRPDSIPYSIYLVCLLSIGHIDNVFTTLIAAQSIMLSTLALQQQHQQEHQEHQEQCCAIPEVDSVAGFQNYFRDIEAVSSVADIGSSGISSGNNNSNKRQKRNASSSVPVTCPGGGSASVTDSTATAAVDIVSLYQRLDPEISALEACVDALHTCSDVDILYSTLYATAGVPMDHSDPVFPSGYANALSARAVSIAKGTGVQECLLYAKYAGLKQTFQPVYSSKTIALRRDRSQYVQYLHRLQCSMFDDHCNIAVQGFGSSAVRGAYTIPGEQRVNQELLPFVKQILNGAADGAAIANAGATAKATATVAVGGMSNSLYSSTAGAAGGGGRQQFQQQQYQQCSRQQPLYQTFQYYPHQYPYPYQHAHAQQRYQAQTQGQARLHAPAPISPLLSPASSSLLLTAPAYLSTLTSHHTHFLQCIVQYQGVFSSKISYQTALSTRSVQAVATGTGADTHRQKHGYGHNQGRISTDVGISNTAGGSSTALTVFQHQQQRHLSETEEEITEF